MSVDLSRIREKIVVALFSDDDLFDQIVLKGGNALELVHKIGQRGSLDLDFSLAGEFADIERTATRVRAALERHLDAEGLVVFDFAFEEKPANPPTGIPPWWGGYVAIFKLVSKDSFRRFSSDPVKLRNRAIAVDDQHHRKFKIDFSKREHCEGKVEVEIDDYRVYAYSLEMIAVEKLRAICQQHPKYPHIPPRRKRSRARDFYDIERIVAAGTDLTTSDALALIRQIFAVKEVELSLLREIETQRPFHSGDWDSVRTAVRGHVAEFDYYFEYVSELASRLSEALGDK